ncbi:MAG: response regulator [Chthoniobacterales bacterium]
MKVQTKLTLLLLIVVATFLAGLAAFRAYDQTRFQRIADERYAERSSSFERVLAKHGEKLETFAKDDSASDQLVAATATDNAPWFADNLSVPRLESYGANAVWVYRQDGSLIHHITNLAAEPLGALPILPVNISKVFRNGPLAHFFIALPRGVMEIRGATIHRAKDFSRQEPASGFLFVGRLWNQPLLDDMSMFTGNDVSLEPAKENYTDESGQLAFSQTLRAWDGKPVAQLVVRNESGVVRELRRSNQRVLLWLILFALVLLLLLSTSLLRWVRRPLRRIMASLTNADPAPIQNLMRDRSEFGELARTVQKFFEQRASLLQEMEERRVTEEALHHSEEALRQSQKMEAVGRLAGGIAHDFNNLLTAIIGYAELINARKSKDTVIGQHADLIRKAGEQAATLTRQLLAFSRKQHLQPRVIDLNQLVAGMENLLRRVIGERINVRTRATARLGTVLADPSQLEQVVLNLGVNARDAMRAGGDLIIRTATVQLDEFGVAHISGSLPPGDYVELAVTDCGMGMDDETKSRIFEPFFTTKGPGQGTGLGLATVYGIVSQSGGGICVESEVGQGSTFRIFFPLERSPVAPPKPTLPPPVHKSETFETILVVEDEEVVRELVCAVLTEEGYHVLCAESGFEALRMADEFDGPIHLLVSDVIMPQMNGPEVAAQLRQTRPETRVLYVSGYSDNDIGRDNVMDESFDLLQKPFTPQALTRKVHSVIREGTHAETTRA